MYFSFLKDSVVNWDSEEKEPIHWGNMSHSFLRSSMPSNSEIAEQEARLQKAGYYFPMELKAFWNELGCGYLCSTDQADNGLEEPKTILDIYFREGDWANVKFDCDIFAENELPFFRISDLSYLTIGLKEGINLGRIYHFGEEIAPDLISFIKQILVNPTYYLN